MQSPDVSTKFHPVAQVKGLGGSRLKQKEVTKDQFCTKAGDTKDRQRLPYVSLAAIRVVAGVIPFDLQALKRKAIYETRKNKSLNLKYLKSRKLKFSKLVNPYCSKSLNPNYSKSHSPLPVLNRIYLTFRLDFRIPRVPLPINIFHVKIELHIRS